MATILVADNDPAVRETSRVALTAAGHSVIAVSSVGELLMAITRGHAHVVLDVVLAEMKMPGMSGIELCKQIIGNRPDLPVVIMTGDGRLDTAINAVRAGAYDYLLKPFALPALLVSIERAIQHHALQRQIELLRRPYAEDVESDQMLGRSEPMRLVFDVIDRVADSETSVLIVGPSGSGKERIARALHEKSRRRSGKLVFVDCAAIPESVLETALFGQPARGPTDARASRGGLLGQADGGTLVLDEVGRMPLSLQAKLLQALEERRVRSSDSSLPTLPTKVDVRLIGTTRQDLDLAVQEKRFREDLLRRIDVVQIALPPLNTRGTDILLLAEQFLKRFASRASRDIRALTPAAAERLLAYGWPNNVRELQNTIERAVALCRHDELGLEDLPERIRSRSSSTAPLSVEALANLPPLREIERRYISRVLALTDNNKTTASRVLGIDRKTLYRKLESEELASASPSDPFSAVPLREVLPDAGGETSRH